MQSGKPLPALRHDSTAIIKEARTRRRFLHSCPLPQIAFIHRRCNQLLKRSGKPRSRKPARGQKASIRRNHNGIQPQPLCKLRAVQPSRTPKCDQRMTI
jgi:hypothetical protein